MQDAQETTRSSRVSALSFTPKTMVLSAPPAGAETSTRLEPFSRCIAALALSLKMPVHSIATSMSDHGSALGSRSAVTLIGPRPTSMVSPSTVTVPGKRPCTKS